MLASPTKHAIRAVLYLANKNSSAFLSVRDIAENTEVPAPYLAKLVKLMANKDILETKRGVSGGVRLLNKQASFYTICLALNDPILFEHCFLSKSKCDAENACPFHEMWKGEREKLITFLKNTKIAGTS